MVEAMIKNARAAEQSVIAYWKKLKPHYPDHPEAPLWMACLAAFPVGITIDLLYQLWANFRELKDRKGKIYQLPPLVVNDCILSPLFRLTGKDIYEMPSDTRAFLLNVFRQTFGEEIIKDLASFLFKYIQEKKTNDLSENYYNAQEWTALLAVDAKQAAMNILTSLKTTEKDQQRSIGVTNLLTTLVKENHDLAEMLRKAIDKKQSPEEINEVAEPATEYDPFNKINKNINIRPATEGTGITIDLPATLSNTLMPLYKAGVAETLPGSDPDKQGVAYAIIVVGSTYPIDRQNAIDFSEVIRNKKLVEENNIYTFYEESATYARVTEVLRNVLSQATADDTVLFCYLGEAVNEEGVTQLTLQESSYEQSANLPNNLRTLINALSDNEFSDLVKQHATGNPAIILVLDAINCNPFNWLPESYPNHVVITDKLIADPSEISAGLVSPLFRLLYTSKQNLTYKEIFAHFLTVEYQTLRVIIQPEFLDNYFLTNRKQSPVLQNQRLLAKLGYSLFVDGQPGQQYKKVLQDFITNYELTPDDDVLPELKTAVQLKGETQIKILYFIPVEEELPIEMREQHKWFRQEFKKEMESGNRVIITFIGDSDHEDEDFGKFIYESIKANHLVIFGMNVSWISDAEIINSLYSLLNMIHVLDQHVYFVIEQECNWRAPPITNNTVLPLTYQPISQGSGMEEFIRNLSAIVEPMEKYLLPEHPAADQSIIEQRIREARKTKELNLSGLSLTEIPPAVFQIEGLESLDLSNNNIANLPEDIGQLHTLRKVNLSKTVIESLSEYIILLQLEEIDLRETRVDRLPRSIGQLRNLKTLRIDHTRIQVLLFGSFSYGFPRELTYEGLNLLNLESNLPISQVPLGVHFAKLHTNEYAILEIHSEHAIPHFDTVPNGVTDKVHYGFHSQIETLQELFDIIFSESGSKHTIVYLCDEKNILSPQFGDDSERHNLIFQYWQAFGKPLNLIINNPLMYSGAFADLIGTGELNFAAVRNDVPIKGDAFFPGLFFKKIWQHSNEDQITGIFIVKAGSGGVNDEQHLKYKLQEAGYRVFDQLSYSGTRTQINKGNFKVDLVILIINDSAGINKRSIREVKDQYEAAVQLNRKIILFLHDNLSADSDPLIAELLKNTGADAIIEVYKNEKDLLEKTQSTIAHFKGRKHADKRMSLANTLKYIEQENIRNNIELGYHVYVNYDTLNDFSLPPGKKKPRKSTNKPAPKPSPRKQKTELKPFNGKWVLVVGSGNERLEQSEMLSALAVGNMLAKEGYGLICGGWPGVDYFVSQAFQEVYSSKKVPVKPSLLQLLNPGQNASTGGKHMVLKTTEWNEYAFKKAMAVVVIGGASLTMSTYEHALKKQIPVIPIPGTHKAAADIYNKLKNDPHLLYHISILQSMEADVDSEAEANKAALMVELALDELPENRIVSEPFKTSVERLYKEREIKVPDDLQKSRWGGKATNNGKRLQARVVSSDPSGTYDLLVSVSGKPLTGQVALFLHNSFKEEILYTTAVNNEAQFDLVSYEAFTVGAYTEDGAMLELDLNKVNGFPPAFYYHDPTPAFKELVESIYNSNPSKDRNDLQKERWGGRSGDENLSLNATVGDTYLDGWYNVHIVLKAENNRPFYGEVALFIHDEFDHEIRYRKVRDGEASLNVMASQAFTIGAYTDEGIFLELDLQEQKGYPKAFYKKGGTKPKQSSKPGNSIKRKK